MCLYAWIQCETILKMLIFLVAVCARDRMFESVHHIRWIIIIIWKKSPPYQREMNNYDMTWMLSFFIRAPLFMYTHRSKIHPLLLLSDVGPLFFSCCCYCCSSSSAHAQVCLHSTSLLHKHNKETTMKTLTERVKYDLKKNVRIMLSFSSCKSALGTHDKGI